jgi:type IV fimbrial biogenesis protein FimT
MRGGAWRDVKVNGRPWPSRLSGGNRRQSAGHGGSPATAYIGRMSRSRHGGFTLMELMVTLALAAVLVALAIPNMRDFLRNGRLTSAANDLLHSLNLARTEAIKGQNGNVVVCGTSDPSAADAAIACSYNSFSGWFVFLDINGNWAHDAGEAVIERHALVDATVTLKADNSNMVSYSPTGFANLPAAGRVPTASAAICDVRGNQQSGNGPAGVTSTARALFIAPTGRARVSRTYADATAAIAAVGGCP